MARRRTTKPNIVFIHAESMDGRVMGCAGHPAMARATPNLDALAASGARFTNAYSNCPVCNPSRASMWTGQYPHYYECWNNHEGITRATPTLFDAMRNGGYETSAIGPLDYLHGMHSIRDRIGSWTRAAGILRPICRTPVPVVSDEVDFFHRDRELTDKAVENITRAGERPFFLYLTTGLVHPAFQAHPRHMDLIDDGAIDIPPTLCQIDTTAHPILRYMRTTKHCEHRFSEWLVREVRHVYFAMIAALDELVGRVVDAVHRAGLADRTYVVFSSDHGEMAGEQNQILKRSMFEPSVHVPLIVSGPGLKKGATCDRPVSLVDLYPTFLDMAGLVYHEVAREEAGYPEAPAGESLLPQAADGRPRRRDWAFSEYHGDRCPTGTYMLRRDKWKYVRYEGYEPMLFDVEDDPWEERNLASARNDLVAELDSLLTSRFDCSEIDRRAKEYDRRSFVGWRKAAREAGVYEETMSRVYSGFDRLCIEDIVPWRDEDERKITAWLAS